MQGKGAMMMFWGFGRCVGSNGGVYMQFRVWIPKENVAASGCKVSGYDLSMGMFDEFQRGFYRQMGAKVTSGSRYDP